MLNQASLFDPGGYFSFDLAQGSVRTRGGSRVVLMADAVVGPLVSAAVKSGDLTALRRLGNYLGAEVTEALGSSALQAAPEAVASRAQGVMALFGWGKLQLERWGDALVVVLEQAPFLDEDRLAVAALLGGLFSTLAAQEVACVPVSPAQRFMLVDPSIAERVWTLSKNQRDLTDILKRLLTTDVV